ncbi:MAG: putative addiction module antidote protein [Proteobacteria bacterium]|nr:putative addiction module antidote protein [Pseudomonadota bacterium]
MQGKLGFKLCAEPPARVSAREDIYGIVVSGRKPYVVARIADYLSTPKDVANYLNAALEDGDERVLLAALRDAVEAVGGMAEVARRTALSREALYRALSVKGNPRWSTLSAVLRALGVRLSVAA